MLGKYYLFNKYMKKYGGASSQTNMVLYVILGIFLVGMIFFGVGFKVGHASMERFQGEYVAKMDPRMMMEYRRVLTPAQQAAALKETHRVENKAPAKQAAGYKWVCGMDGCKWRK